MVNKPLIRPYFLEGVALGGVARIPMVHGTWTQALNDFFGDYTGTCINLKPTAHTLYP